MIEEYDDEPLDEIRGAEEVARRCVVLYAVLAAGHRHPRGELVAWLRREGVWEAASPEESDFLLSDSPTQRQTINATWRAEALFPLVWALGLIPELPAPTQICDVQRMLRVLPPLLGAVGDFIGSAKLRQENEILDAHENVFQIHWLVRDAEIHGRPTPDGYDPGVVRERHYGLNWLIGSMGLDWDDVTTDT